VQVFQVNPMSLWEAYPQTYRHSEVSAILAAVRAGECAALVGLSGAGKSNLLGFIAQRLRAGGLPRFVLVDCNRLAHPTISAFFELLASLLGGNYAGEIADLPSIDRWIAGQLETLPGICLLLDRLDAFPPDQMPILGGNLRSLRDDHKYSLTYLSSTRRPLDPDSELAELFYANTIWLGPLSADDARWSAASFAARRGLAWDEAVLERLLALTWGYPSFLRAACEAYAAGVPLEVEALWAYPAVQQRLAEFWRDGPSPEDLKRSGLWQHPLLSPVEPAEIDPASLSAGEYNLWTYFQAHPGQVCSKDDLIRAVWPEEVYTSGIRDDSLAQLVHRLRTKIEPDPANPRRILTVPGRGYRFTG
jgi:hypothetical protein